MGGNKQYSEYTAYQYLEPGIDYKVFKLREAIKKDWAYTVPLSKAEEERAEAIMEKNLVIDLHEHANIRPDDISLANVLLSEDRPSRSFSARLRMWLSPSPATT